MMFIRGIAGKRRAGAAPVYLNVYDLTPINGYAYWLGLGVYHSGVQVHGVEYAYGAHEHPTTGIFEGEPRQCPGFRFRRSIPIGRTDLGPREVRALMEELATEYTGDTYNLISKNCNHFCDDACLRLSSTPIPKWVNRLAKIGAHEFFGGPGVWCFARTLGGWCTPCGPGVYLRVSSRAQLGFPSVVDEEL